MNSRLLAVLLVLAAPAHAETLADALAFAQRTSPVLLGQQALAQATGETAEQARAGWRPTVTATVDSGYNQFPAPPAYQAGSFAWNDAEAIATASQPLYTGGRVANAVRAADIRTQAGRQNVRLAGAQLFQSVVGAYMDVLRDRDILAVRQADVTVLGRQATETRSRYDLGAGVTRTDVAQADAQREAAVATLANARAELAASEANFGAVVGSPPQALVACDGLPDLPRSLGEALRLADAANPSLAQSRLAAEASSADIATARSGWFPTVTLQGSFGTVGPVAPFAGGRFQDREASATLTITQPILTGGLVASEVRQARDRHDADRDAIDQAARLATQSVVTAWNQIRTGQAALQAGDRQVEAASLALRGYELEYADGLRSTSDLLIADENLRAAEVSRSINRHDTVVAEASLLASVGRD